MLSISPVCALVYLRFCHLKFIFLSYTSPRVSIDRGVAEVTEEVTEYPWMSTSTPVNIWQILPKAYLTVYICSKEGHHIFFNLELDICASFYTNCH